MASESAQASARPTLRPITHNSGASMWYDGIAQRRVRDRNVEQVCVRGGGCSRAPWGNAEASSPFSLAPLPTLLERISGTFRCVLEDVLTSSVSAAHFQPVRSSEVAPFSSRTGLPEQPCPCAAGKETGGLLV